MCQLRCYISVAVFIVISIFGPGDSSQGSEKTYFQNNPPNTPKAHQNRIKKGLTSRPEGFTRQPNFVENDLKLRNRAGNQVTPKETLDSYNSSSGDSIRRFVDEFTPTFTKKDYISITAQPGGAYQCLGMTPFMYQAQRSIVTKTLPTLQETRTNVSISIDHRSSCNNVSLIHVSIITFLNISVETCCITKCLHTSEITVSENQHILLNFTSFNIPGLNLLVNETSEECSESLDVEVDVPDKNTPNRSITHKMGSFCGMKEPKVIFIDYSKVKLKLRLRDNKQCIDKMSFAVNIIPCEVLEYKSCNASEYVHFGKTSGFIISPGRDKQQNYPNNLDCTWSIQVPDEKLILLDVDIYEPLGEGDFIEIRIDEGHGLEFPNVLRSTSFHFRWPVVLPRNYCTVEFHSDSIKSGAGFNISYKAVDKQNFIELYSNFTMNCTNITVIPRTTKCNFYEECAGGEDEINCIYKDDKCWPSGVYFEKSCYYPVRDKSRMSWTMAQEYCERTFNAHLLTIKIEKVEVFVNKFRTFLGKKFDMSFLGLRRMRMQQVSQLYRRMWQWIDGHTAFYLPKEYRFQDWSRCSLLHLDYFHSTECGRKMDNVSFICEKQIEPLHVTPVNIGSVDNYRKNKETFPMFKCTSEELIFEEQRCDKVDNCFDHSDEMNCDYAKNEHTMFACGTSALLPYSFVCDGVSGCPDESDENHCKIPSKSSLGASLSVCNDGMVLDRNKVCDGREDCLDGSDEMDCTECFGDMYLCPMIACLPKHWITDSEIDCPIRDLKGREAGEIFKENVFKYPNRPGVVYPDGFGKFNITSIGRRDKCPDTHFQCTLGYCIPFYMWCNGMIDCPFGEDENWANCKHLCKGLYKCKYSRVCVHYDNICDNVYHCPYHDDELLCSARNITCPEHCECKRMEYTCTAVPVFNSSTLQPLRYLRLFNAVLPNLQLNGIATYSLIYLNVSHSNVQFIFEENFRYLNLRILDASFNQIEFLNNETFKSCPVLKTLILANNKFHNAIFGFLQHTRELSRLDLSYNTKNELEADCFHGASNLQDLILRSMNILKINKNAFINLTGLKTIDLQGNVFLDVSDPIFHSQLNLREIATDNYRLCCDLIKPASVTYTNCKAPYDEISSCADILRTLLLRAALWIMAILTVFGNTGVIFYRIVVDRGMKQSFRIIITSLSISDLLMGVYLVIIGIADAHYRGNYQLYEKEWTNSVFCQMAGFLCLLSSETSALFILLVTLDRLLAIALPMNKHFHFNGRSAAKACGLVWVIGFCMASIPLLPPFQHWRLYSQNALGVPLPITRSSIPGNDYAFAIFIVFNLVVFILVGLGQLMIYLSVRLMTYPKASKVRVRQDTAIAKRLILVVLTDCLCWFPITVMGMAARAGLPVPGEMNVVATVFLLPANSAFNPFLYTANAILMARKLRRKKKSFDSDAAAMRPLSSS